MKSLEKIKKNAGSFSRIFREFPGIIGKRKSGNVVFLWKGNDTKRRRNGCNAGFAGGG
ncbi:MAG: hypothetical protein HFI66_08525 [Lachnospiraceae bacterium]|nr:hypothetical protein [Lachnospiraceae bacterium]